MPAGFTIEGSAAEGAAEISVSYPDSVIIDTGFDEPFRRQLVQKYEECARNQSDQDCILTISASVAGSPVVRGIFELYKVVRARSGNLFCANYPREYVRALADLGLPSLPGFELCGSAEEARAKRLKLRGERKP
jgi:hypothetical protein